MIAWPTHKVKERKRRNAALYQKKRGRRERQLREGGKRGEVQWQV